MTTLDKTLVGQVKRFVETGEFHTPLTRFDLSEGCQVFFDGKLWSVLSLGISKAYIVHRYLNVNGIMSSTNRYVLISDLQLP